MRASFLDSIKLQSAWVLTTWCKFSKIFVFQLKSHTFADLVSLSAGVSKVAGCWWKSLLTWLILVDYSAWHFFTYGVFVKTSLDWPLTLTTELSTSNLLDNHVSDLLLGFTFSTVYCQGCLIHFFLPFPHVLTEQNTD